MEQTKLLFGEPTRVVKSSHKGKLALEVWMYQTNKTAPFRILVFPLFYKNETYYLYFEENVLVDIRKHYLKQAVGSSPRQGR